MSSSGVSNRWSLVDAICTTEASGRSLERIDAHVARRLPRQPGREARRKQLVHVLHNRDGGMKRGGRPESTRASAAGPPVEAPMAIRGKSGCRPLAPRQASSNGRDSRRRFADQLARASRSWPAAQTHGPALRTFRARAYSRRRARPTPSPRTPSTNDLRRWPSRPESRTASRA